MHRGNVCSSMKHKDGNQKRKIRILMVDDHPSVLAGVRGYLKSRKGLTVVGHTGSGDEGVKMAIALKPDIMVVDLSLPDIGGLEVIRRVRSYDQKVRFLVYSVHESREYLNEALRAGATGFVSKAVSLRRLLIAIKRVASAKTCSAWSVVGTAKRTTSDGDFLSRTVSRDEVATRSDCTLTEREAEILRSLPEGAKLGEIAADLGISYYTVVAHLRSIYSKLGVRNRTAAVSVAHKMGVV